jgi:serine/threonine-protein kinase
MAAEEGSPRSSGRLQVGDVVSGKFRVERVVGEGGMAYVVEATHLLLEERVALKLLRSEVLLRSDIVARFEQEGRAAAKLKSEHVARVIDVGEEQKVPYMVMEYLEGKNLEELVAARGPLPFEEAADFVIQACEGITEAHARGIIHRDIKPANLFVVERKDGWPTVKVLDFGISKAALTASMEALGEKSGRVKTVSLLGSPYYMSPEQLRSTKDVDRRTDVWSLGVVLYELLTGKTPFEAGDFISLAREIFDKPAPKLRERRPEAPAELEAVLDRALTKDPATRYQTAAEFAMALLPFTTSKRSRVIAAHAVTMTRSAGLDPDLPMPSNIPPATSSGQVLVVPTPQSLPRISEVSSGKLAVASTTNHALTKPKDTPLTLPSPEPRRRPMGLVGGIAIGALLAGGMAFMLATRTPTTVVAAPGPRENVQAVQPSAAPPPPVVTLIPTATSEPPAPASASASAAAEAPRPTAPAATTARAPTIAAPKHSATAPAPTVSAPPLDIKLER